MVSSAASPGGGPARRRSLLPALLFGAGFVVTGAGLVPLAGAALLEMSPSSWGCRCGGEIPMTTRTAAGRTSLIEHAETGQGPPVFIAHGNGGGYDQGLAAGHMFIGDARAMRPFVPRVAGPSALPAGQRE